MSFDAAANGLVCTAALGVLLASVLLLAYYRLSQAPPGRAYDPIEILAPRLVQAPPSSRPAPLPLHFPFLFGPTTIPLFPPYPSEGWLSDGEIIQRLAGVLASVVAIFAIFGLAIALPLCVVGVPSLRSSFPPNSTSTLKSGNYSTLEDLSLLRLLHAHDAATPLPGPSSHTRLLLILLTSTIFPAILVIPILFREIRLARDHRRRFRDSPEGGEGWEMGFLSVDANGDAEAARRDVCVEGVYSVPDLSRISELQRAREKVVDQLEEAECAYIAAFEEPPSPLPPPSISSTTPKHLTRKSLAPKPRKTNSSIVPFGPKGHYSIKPASFTENGSSSSLAIEPTLQDEIGRHLVGSSSFTEVGLGERGEEWELGDRLRVNSTGRWSRALTTPALSTFGLDVHGDTTPSPSTSVAPRSFLESGDADTDTLTDQNTVEFPTAPPRPSTPEPILFRTDASTSSSTGFGGLATLDESEDETDDTESQRSRGTLRLAHYREGRALEVSPSQTSGWTESETGRSGWSGAGTSIDTRNYDKDASEVDPTTMEARVALDVKLKDDVAQARDETPELDDLPSIPDSDDENYLSSRSVTMPHPSLDPLSTTATNPSPSRIARRRSHHLSPLSTSPPTPISALDSTPFQQDNSPSPSLRLFNPTLRPAPSVSPAYLAEIYALVIRHRSALKSLNSEIAQLQTIAMAEVQEGKSARGFLLVGRGVGRISGVRRIEGRTRDDVRWHHLLESGSEGAQTRFWAKLGAVCVTFAAAAVVPIVLANSNFPGVADEWTFLRPFLRSGTFPSGLVSSTAASLFVLLLLAICWSAISSFGCRASSVSIARAQQITLQGSLAFSTFAVVWILLFGALAASSSALAHDVEVPRTLADGLAQSTELVLSVAVLAAILRAKTPRQRFEALKSASPNDAHALAGLVLASSALSLTFCVCPLIAGPLLVLSLCNLPAMRLLTTYATRRTFATSGSSATVTLSTLIITLSIQPLLLALLFLSRRLFALAGASFGLSLATLLSLSAYTLLSRRSHHNSNLLSPQTLEALSAFEAGCKDGSFTPTSSSRRLSRASLIPRRSMASVFELLNGISSPSSSRLTRPALPLESEYVDAFADAELASRLHAHAPPNLPPLRFESKRSVEGMWPPELVGGRPKLMLPDDPLAEGEKREMEEYWGIESVWEGAPGLAELP
ncbi:hypothetical protein RQP46_005698 [Phenoliferia psychrophenolica]